MSAVSTGPASSSFLSSQGSTPIHLSGLPSLPLEASPILVINRRVGEQQVGGGKSPLSLQTCENLLRSANTFYRPWGHSAELNITPLPSWSLHSSGKSNLKKYTVATLRSNERASMVDHTFTLSILEGETGMSLSWRPVCST